MGYLQQRWKRERKRSVGDAAAEREVARMAALTPGDFAAVARRMPALGERGTGERVLAELKAEVRVKGAMVGAIGFQQWG
jgi:hypothetical protein